MIRARGASPATTSYARTLTKINVGVEECYTLYPEGNNVAFERNGTRVGTFTVLSGNPQNL